MSGSADWELECFTLATTLRHEPALWAAAQGESQEDPRRLRMIVIGLPTRIIVRLDNDPSPQSCGLTRILLTRA